MKNEFTKPFYEIQKHIPKGQLSLFWIDCEDNSKMVITKTQAEEYILYKLKLNKLVKIKQSQNCIKLQQEAEKQIKKG